jgi:hypothetical protein
MSGAKTRDVELFEPKSLPLHWVARVNGGPLFMFPARANGWAYRAPYLGHYKGLRPVASCVALGTGLLDGVLA